MTSCVFPYFTEDRFAPHRPETWAPFGRKSSVNMVGVMSALRSEADIQLVLTKGAAADPNRTFLLMRHPHPYPDSSNRY